MSSVSSMLYTLVCTKRVPKGFTICFMIVEKFDLKDNELSLTLRIELFTKYMKNRNYKVRNLLGLDYDSNSIILDDIIQEGSWKQPKSSKVM